MQMEPSEKPHTEDEFRINYRLYIDWAFRWAWLIGLCVVIVGGLTLGVSWLMSRSQPYEAAATIVLLKTQTEVSMGSAIKTLSDETLTMKVGQSIDTLQAVGSALTTIEASRTYRRLNSLLGMVSNGAVAEQVSADLKGVLDDKERKVSALSASIRGQLYTPPGSAATKGTTASDSIQIIAKHRDPEKAALMANAWARRYEAYVNTLFGSSAIAPYGDIDAQVKESRVGYDTAQAVLNKYLSEENRTSELQRQIAEEEAVIAKLRTGRQTAAVAIVDKQAAVKQQLVDAYLESDTTNRLLAFNKGQEAKRQIFTTWTDADAASRLAAIKRDRDLRMNVFTATVQSEISSTLKVLEVQRDDILGRLEKAYTRRQTLEGLLMEARLMRDQLTVGGEASARSNALSLFALKNRVFATTRGLPIFDKLDLAATSLDGLAQPRGAADQLADLNGLIRAMESEVEGLNGTIQEGSLAIVQGLGYQGLDQISAAYLAPGGITLTGVTTATGRVLATGAITPTGVTTATGAIPVDLHTFAAQRYADLFGVGAMAQAANDVGSNSPLFAEIRAAYPRLFARDAMMDLTTSVGDKTELSSLASQAVEDLLQMKGLESASLAAMAAKPLSQEILQREDRVRLMQADVARLDQVKADLQRTRDLRWQAYSTLSSKQQEVSIAAATEGTEVKLAAPAVVPSKRTQTTSLSPLFSSVLVGLLAGVSIAFVLQYKGIALEPRDLWAWATPRRRRESGSGQGGSRQSGSSQSGSSQSGSSQSGSKRK